MQKDCDAIVKIYSLDQSDGPAVKAMAAENPQGWDIIIDDASHVPWHQIATFEWLWPSVRANGIYIIEDIESAYVDNGAKIYGYTIEDGGIGKPPPGR